MVRIGIDVGGSFTDCVLVDEVRATVSLVKVPSTPHDPAAGFLAGLQTLCGEHGVDPSAIVALVHGTTVLPMPYLSARARAAG